MRSGAVFAVNIYQIFPDGTSGLVSSVDAPVNPGDYQTRTFNGNAWDNEAGEAGMFYFTRVDCLDSIRCSTEDMVSHLFSNDLDGTQIYLGELDCVAEGAGWYDGFYWYIDRQDDEIHRVTIDLTTPNVTDNVVANIGNGGSPDSFVLGDVTINDAGLMYSSATVDGSRSFFTVDLNGTGFSTITTDPLLGAGGTQIAFDLEGDLYGVNAANPAPYAFFSIESDGASTYIGDVPRFTDIAAGPYTLQP